MDDLLCLVRREHVFRQLVFHARQHDLGSRIVQEMILARHPLKDTLDGLQSGVLRAEAEWGWPLVLRW
ncbi:MAG: hypothetical protein KGM92_16950 [Acidobacteriota bacterium]|nr:hypothetical protein [Acidobacteriota bacterium]